LMTLRQPGWFRALELVFGLAAVFLALLVLAFPGLGIASLIVVLALGLLFASFRTVSILGLKRLPVSLKVLAAVSGILGLLLAVLSVVFPALGAAELIVLLSFGLLVYGLNRIFHGYMHKGAAGWHRATVLAIGLLAVILSVVVLAVPSLALVTLSDILAVVLLLVGLEMVVSGATGISMFVVVEIDKEKASPK